MSAADSPKLLKQAIHDGRFDPVYYLYGGDDFLKDEAIRRLIEAAVDPATRDFNLEIRRGGELDAGALGSLADTPPMMAERRVVVIREVNALRKDARAALDAYLRSPASDTILVLVAPSGAKPDAKLCDRATAIAYDPLRENLLPRWIAQQAETVHRTAISAGACSLLHGAVGNDLAQLSAELDKLASYTNGAMIDEAAVAAVVGIRRGETLGDLLDRVAERDAVRALELLPHVLAQPKLSAVQIVMALTVQTMALSWARAAIAEGVPARALTKRLYDFLKCGSSFTGRPWSELVTTCVRTVDRWPAGDLDRALAGLLAADAALKESRLSSDQQLLSTLLLSLCRVPSRRSAA